MLGASLQLFDGATPQANLTGIQAFWWDVTDSANAGRPAGRSETVTTDASGFISLDLSGVSGLTVGASGFLVLYKLNTGNHENSLIFSGQVVTSTVASGTSMRPAGTPWVRDPCWLPLPAVANTEQKVVGLYAVTPGMGFAAFTVAGAFTVDWGDGTALENVATGVKAEHIYDYADADLNGTNGPVTFTDVGDLVNRTAHGHVNGNAVQFYGIVSTTGIVEGQTYFVVNAATDTFQVAATRGGAALTLTTNGSGALLPYKQAIITITPQAANNLTSVNIGVRHSATVNPYTSGWLDVLVSGPNLTVLTVGSISPAVRHSRMEQFQFISANSVANASYMLANARALRSVPVLNIAAATNCAGLFASCHAIEDIPALSTSLSTNFSNMFDGCYALRSVPLFDTSAANTLSTMFSLCYSLEVVPQFNTAAATAMNSMFSNCTALKSIPLLNTGLNANFTGMFNGCGNLESVPLLNTASATTFASMFFGCKTLRTIPLLNTALVNSMSSAFEDCRSLTEVPLLNTASVNNFSNMFANCHDLETVPLLDTSAGTTVSAMFNNCYNLKMIPLFNTVLCATFSSMFNGCLGLVSVPALNTAAGTAFTNMFSSCASLASAPLAGTTKAISYSSANLSAAALNAIYTALGTAVTQTITVSTNYGTTGDDPTIATAKGWTVTG